MSRKVCIIYFDKMSRKVCIIYFDKMSRKACNIDCDLRVKNDDIHFELGGRTNEHTHKRI
jgi:hypothetical protein